MTFCHIRLKKISEDAIYVIYAAISPDFNKHFSDETMAEIILNKKENTYDFVPGEKWVLEKTLPPLFYSLSGEKQSELMEHEYKGYGNGAWTMRIHHWITQFIQEKLFPDIYPH